MAGKSFVDARGQVQSAMGVVAMQRLIRERGISEGLLRRLVRSRIAKGDRDGPQAAAKILAVILVLLVVAGLATKYFELDSALLGTMMVLSVLAGLMTVVALVIFRVTMAEERPLELPRVGLCACCGYEIAGLPASEGQIIVCPECGASYREAACHLPTERTLEKVSWIVPWWDSRWRKVRRSGWQDPAAPARAMEMADHPRMLGMGAVYLGLAIGFVWVALQMAMPREWANAAAAYGFPVYIFGIGWVMTRTIRLRLRREGWCPACLASLADVPPEDDGCKVCAVCGAAWKVKH